MWHCRAYHHEPTDKSIHNHANKMIKMNINVCRVCCTVRYITQAKERKTKVMLGAGRSETKIKDKSRDRGRGRGQR